MFVLSSSVSTQTINLTIKDIRGTEGYIAVGIFADEEGFKTEKPMWLKKISKSTVQHDSMQVQIPIQAGQYGISVLDDKNNTGKMEYSFLGVPRKGFGFSNYYHKGLRKPTFDDFDFYIEKNESKYITVKLKYYWEESSE